MQAKEQLYIDLLERCKLEVDAHNMDIDPDLRTDVLYNLKLERYNQLLSWGFNDFHKIPWVIAEGHTDRLSDEEKAVRADRNVTVDPSYKLVTPVDEVEEEPEEFICIIDGKPSKHKSARACVKAGGTWELVD